ALLQGPECRPGGGGVLAVAVDGDAADHLAEGAEGPDVVILAGDEEAELPSAPGLEQEVVDVTGMVRDQDRRPGLGERGGLGLEAVDQRAIGRVEIPEEGEETAELPVGRSLRLDR